MAGKYIHKQPKRAKKSWLIVLGGIALCAILFLFPGNLRAKNDFNGHTDEAAAAVTESEQQKVSVTDFVHATMSLAEDLKALLGDVKGGNLENAKSKIDPMTQNVRTLQASLDSSIHSMGILFPGVKTQLLNIRSLLSVAEIGLADLLEPAIDQLQAYPLSGLRVDGGISTVFLGHYIDFAESIMSDVKDCIELANTIDFSIIDRDGKIAELLNLSNQLLDIYESDKALFSKVKAMIGAEEDRLYLLAAQNSAEIRASGGFPGSMGSIRITDGVLSLGGFQSVYNLLAPSVYGKVDISPVERKMFSQLSGMSAPRDAVLCPDFERVAYIWSVGYESVQPRSLNGVISMTPCIVQRLLAASDEEVVLFDGLVLNKGNATKVLQHDIYFKYFGKTYIADGHQTADSLFADAADKTMQKIMDHLSIHDFLNYISVAQESFSDRTLMVWMKNEEEQNLIRQLGWNGGLNTDPEKPQTGVYFNCTVASKMGWYLVMDTEIGTRTRNDDGSYTYPVTVTFLNNITRDEIQAANSAYIFGGNNGVLNGTAFFFAPAGGTVDNFTVSNGNKISKETYHDLSLGYLYLLSIYPQKSITVTYDVTTAPGVETPLTFSKTPTVQDYH